MSTLLPIALMLVLLALGLPVAFALLIAGVAGILMGGLPLDATLSILGVEPFGQVANYTLIAVPLFVFMSYLLSSAGFADELFDGIAGWVSRRRGGLAIATVASSAVFGALSGSTSAAASSLSQVSMPNMRRRGYSESMAGGTIALGSTLAVLIPPSIMMIVYGVATETSINDLFLAGIGPGVLLGLLLIFTIAVWVRLRPGDAPDVYSVPLVKRLRQTAAAWPAILVVAVILILLYSGFATATEVAGIGVVVSVILAGALRRLTWKNLMSSVVGTVDTTVMIFIILIGGTLFGNFLSRTQLAAGLVSFVDESGMNRWLVIALIVIAYFVLSSVMDEIPLLLITLPFTLPIILNLGFDPVWFGVLSMLMVIMGLVFPPVGIIAYIVSGAAKVPVSKVFAGSAVLLIPVVVVTALLMFFPQIALALPGFLR